MTRGRFQGMRQIAAYHWRTYATAAAAIVMSFLLSEPWRAAALAIALPGAIWACVSLAVSYYVYDWSAIFRLDWLPGLLLRTPHRWVNIHAGLDETSLALADLFPNSSGEILDIYDPVEMTEPSIERARLLAGPQAPAIAANWRALPLHSESVDTVFAIFAAHEIRRSEARLQFFQELSRILRRGGEVVLVEHLRDWHNFLAFGPGFLHFLPESAWSLAANGAGFELRLRLRLTPFVRVFVLRRFSERPHSPSNRRRLAVAAERRACRL
jgi:SAM-dependent methyltransferase